VAFVAAQRSAHRARLHLREQRVALVGQPHGGRRLGTGREDQRSLAQRERQLARRA
jgi:hypothetical protein